MAITGSGSIRFSINESDLTTASTTAKYTLGATATDDAGNGWIYVYASPAALTQYQPYIVRHNGTYMACKALVTTNGGKVAVPQYTIASGSYGFVQYAGTYTVALGATTVAVGDNVKGVANTTSLAIDGTSGSTAQDRQSTTVGTALQTGISKNIKIYAYGDPVSVA